MALSEPEYRPAILPRRYFRELPIERVLFPTLGTEQLYFDDLMDRGQAEIMRAKLAQWREYWNATSDAAKHYRWTRAILSLHRDFVGLADGYLYPGGDIIYLWPEEERSAPTPD